MTHGQHFKTTDVLRLEVEVPPTGLYNMISNPDGALGGWGWITPVSGSYIIKSIGFNGLNYTSPTPSAASYFYSEAMPISAGQYAAASWFCPSITSGYIRAQFEWLNSSLVVVGSSTQTGYLGSGQQTLAPQLAPANTAFCRLRFDHYANTSGGNPSAGSVVQLTNVKVAKAATSAALGSTRKNLVTNPSFEVDTAGWSGASGTIARSTAQASAGVGSLALTLTGTGGGYAYAAASVIGGRDYTLQVKSRAATTPRSVGITLEWFDAGGNFLGATGKTSTANTTTGWTTHSITVTAPSAATTARPDIGVMTSIAGEVHYFDAVMVTEGTDVPTYFDGSTAASGTFTYSWDGTAHASPSNMIDSTLGSLADTTWRNILGPTHDIKIERETLNLGTLTATVLDSTLDPSQTANLRPGRRVRLLALSGTTWENVFTGKATQIDVEYEEKAVPAKPPRVFLTAVDATQGLAAASRPDGVGTIDALPYVLEGAGVPWKVNGSGNQVPTATVVSNNDKATALDQVAITRDSELGAAWVDRYGVLNVQSPVTQPVVPNPGFEVNTTGWTATNGTLARVTTPVRTGTGSLRSTATAAGLMAPRTTGNQIDGVIGGVQYTAEAYSRAATTGRSVLVWIKFSNSSGIVIAESGGTGVTNNTTGWTKSTHTALAPPGTRYMDVELRVANAAASEIHYFDDLSVVTTVITVLNESVYSDFDVSFSSADCINSVTVKAITWDPTDSTKSVENTYGPYEDSTSIESWGRRTAEFTVHGISAGGVAAYAAKILARNANPGVRVNTLALPIKETTDISTSKALLDLGAVVNVVNTAKAINQDLRVNSITHTILPEKWMVDLGFEHKNSVAAPQVTPPVQSSSNFSGWQTPTLSGTWSNFGSGFTPVRYRKVDGIVYLQGLIRLGTGLMFTLPAGYCPATGTLLFIVATDAGSGRVDVETNGKVSQITGTNAYVSLAGISFPAEA